MLVVAMSVLAAVDAFPGRSSVVPATVAVEKLVVSSSACAVSSLHLTLGRALSYVWKLGRRLYAVSLSEAGSSPYDRVSCE